MALANASGRPVPTGRPVKPLSLYGRLGFWRTLGRQWQLAVLSVPFLLFILLNNYFPIWGWAYAFFPATNRMMPDWSHFVGFEMFQKILQKEMLYNALRNTLGISSLKLVFGFVFPITFAVLLNEIKTIWFKRTVQTISYLPYFISWVIASTIICIAVSPEDGIVNNVLVSLGIIPQPVNWVLMNHPGIWLFMAVTETWKTVGWNAIIYLAAMTGIDPDLYEAASIDGAGRVRKILNITLPGIAPTIQMLLILNVGWLLSAGFEQILLLGRPYTYEFSEVLDTYIYRLVWGNMSQMRSNIPMGTAAGIMNSVISFILVFSANRLSKRISGERLF